MRPKRSLVMPLFAVLALALAALACDSAQDQDVGGNKTVRPTPTHEITSAPESTPTPESIATLESTTTPADTPPPTTAPSRPQAEIVISSLNMREGPGTDYAVVGAASAGDLFEIIGIDPATGWLQVADAHGDACWISGNSKYIRVVGTLDGVPTIQALPPTPTLTSTPTPVAETLPTATLEPPTDTPAPVPTPTSRPTLAPKLAPIPTIPAPSSGSSGCCKHCGSNSKACGNGCISLSKTCHQPPGCACD
jgi:hypothetical protein